MILGGVETSNPYPGDAGAGLPPQDTMKRTTGTSPQTGQPFSIEETDSQSSVEVTLNAKGEAVLTVKSYAVTTDAAATEALEVLTRTLLALHSRSIPVAGNVTPKAV